MSKPLLDRRWPWLVAAGAIVVAYLSTLVEIRFGPPEVEIRPVGSVADIEGLREREDLNVLFILIDTLRADRLGSYGYERDTSPELDRLASSGVRFARHLAQSSWTKSSMASLWTSRNPANTGINRYDDVLPEQAVLPAEIFKQAGFRTVGIYRNGWVAPTFGFQQGFDVYTRPVPGPRPPSVRASNPTLRVVGTDEDVIGAALEFLRVHGDERWFLYLHLMDVHEYQYDEQSARFGGTYSDIYDNAILWVDGAIRILIEHLADQGHTDNTLIVVGSDHGEAFRERGVEGHARLVYPESTEVPFFVVFPFRLEPGAVVDARSRNVDIWPTVLDLVGLPVPAELDGRSLVPDLVASARGEPLPEADRTGIAHLDQNWGQRERGPLPTVAVADGPHRYVRANELGKEVERLFDASQDPKELDDRAEADPETLARLREVADAYLATEPSWGEAPTRELGELELNHLRALGYAVP